MALEFRLDLGVRERDIRIALNQVSLHRVHREHVAPSDSRTKGDSRGRTTGPPLMAVRAWKGVTGHWPTGSASSEAPSGAPGPRRFLGLYSRQTAARRAGRPSAGRLAGVGAVGPILGRDPIPGGAGRA